MQIIGLHKKIVTWLFCSVIIFGLAAQITLSVTATTINSTSEEKERLASLKKSNFWKYANIFDEYFRKNFPFRNQYLHFVNDFGFKFFLKSNTKRVLIGRDQWLFNGDENIEIHQGRKRFSSEELFVLKKYYEAKSKIIENTGAKYILLLIPNKESIYPEFYPEKYPIINTENRYDQFVRYLDKNKSFLTVIHPKKELMTAKTVYGPLYHKYDSHWNDIGAFIAYQALAVSMQKTFPNIKVTNFENYQVVNGTAPNGLARMLGLSFSLREAAPALRYKETIRSKITEKTNIDELLADEDVGKYKDLETTSNNCIKLKTCHDEQLIPRILIYRDSFASRLKQFLIHHAKEMILMKRKLGENKDLDPEIAIQVKPALVIDQFLERRFFIPDKYDYHSLVRKYAK